MRVVLDTNIFVSALISRAGTPARIVRAWSVSRFILVSHPLQLAELRNVTRRENIRMAIRPAEAGRLVNEIALVAELPKDLPLVERSPDPADDFLLALCQARQADWLVTGDKNDLLALGRNGRTQIVTAAAFADALNLG